MTRPTTVLGTVVAVAAAILIWLFTDDGNGGNNDARSDSSTSTSMPTETAADRVDESDAAGSSPTEPVTTARATTAAPTASADVTVPPFADNFDTIDAADLPPEGRDTLDLIDGGGPFPYDQDGGTFQNREGILPDRPPGYYHEYTVETPGSDDRGARRIITGAEGEIYYTEDHYDSFVWVLR